MSTPGLDPTASAGSPLLAPRPPSPGGSPTHALPAAAASAVNRLRCLVVDDHPEVVRTVAAILTPALSVAAAGDGAAALAALERDPPDVLLLDLMLPDMHGLRVLDTVRALRPELPVVILTGHSSEAAAIASANLGVSGYVVKPFTVAELRWAVARALVLRLGRRLMAPGEETILATAEAVNRK